MRFNLLALGTTTLAFATLTGCIPQTQYDDLMTNNRSLKQQVAQLQGELDTSSANEEMLRKQLAEAAADLLKAKTLAGASDEDIQALTDRYNKLLSQVNALDVLPTDVSAALEDIAAASGGLLTFDKAKGMLRFSSDVTFDSGSAQLTEKAKNVLAQVAAVLNGNSASGLEVQVVGHTDSVAIRKANTVAQHPTNMHLSAHRAISVRETLVSDGVGANRFMVAGYGEFRPVTENSTKGAQANRRVELYLKPSTETTPTVTATETTATAPTPVAATTDDDNVK
jgi:chemotaxis protein MotB